MLLGSLRKFAVASQPMMARPSYAHELVTASTFPMAVAMLESGVIGVLAKKTFHVTDFELATIMAAPIFANLTSFMWAMLARGRGKVRFITSLQLSVLLILLGISFLPTVGPGPTLLVVAVVLARCALAGIVTLRSTVWRQNYPEARRAQITGRFTVVVTLIMAVGPLIGFVIEDLATDSFRWFFRLATLVAAVGIYSFSGIRVRGERHLLSYERQSAAKPQPHGDPGRVYAFEPEAGSVERHTVWTVLREDHGYRWYMIWMFVGGMANLISNFALMTLVIQLTHGMDYEYTISTLINTAIPMAVAMLAVPYWAGYLDRVHIARFRSRQGLFWIVTQMGTWLAGLTGMVWLFALPRVVDGVARGGGMLAWNLGHNDFADRRMVPLYMGIHVTLTGVRGFLAPYLAVTMLYGWSPDVLPGLTVPGFSGIGVHVFLVTATLALISQLGFLTLSRAIKNRADESVE